MAAGGSAVTLNKLKVAGREVWEIVCDWTAGAVDQIVQQNIAEKLLAEGRIDVAKITGKLLAIETIPGLNGNLATTIPTSLADHTFLDDYSFDLGEGIFVNQSTGASNKKYCNPPVVVNGEIQLNISTVGASKTGRDILWIEVEN